MHSKGHLQLHLDARRIRQCDLTPRTCNLHHIEDAERGTIDQEGSAHREQLTQHKKNGLNLLAETVKKLFFTP